jgi:hypothetical protein
MELSKTILMQEKAILCYEKQLARVRKYNESHKEDLNAKSREYFQKIKADPERYKLYKEQKRNKYKNKKTTDCQNILE